MNKYIVGIVSIFSGILVYALMHDWIIFYGPMQTTSYTSVQPLRQKPVSISLYAFVDGQWHIEEIEVTLPEDKNGQVQLLLNKLCAMLEEEELISSNVLVESATYTFDNKELIISLTKNPFAEYESVMGKLILLESFLRTLRSNNITNVTVRFLVYHEPISDDYLSFAQPFSVQGYIQEQH